MNPVVLESKKPRVVLLRPTHIKFFGSIRFPGFNSSPQKPWYGSKLIEPRIRTSVLVIDDVFVFQGENSGQWALVLIGHADLERFVLALNQISKPVIRNRRKAVASS